MSDSVVASRQFAKQGLNALERSDLTEAEKYCSQAVRACPSDPNARRSYADVLWAQGRTKEALEQIDSALASGIGGDVETRLRAAEMRLQSGKLDAALVDVEQAIDADPKSAEAWALRGRVMLAKGNTKQSLADMQRSLIYAPRRRDVLRQTAELYQSLGEPHKALASLQELGDTYGPGEEPQEIYVAQGNVYAALARPAEAAEQFRTAISRGIRERRPAGVVSRSGSRVRQFDGGLSSGAASAGHRTRRTSPSRADSTNGRGDAGADRRRASLSDRTGFCLRGAGDVDGSGYDAPPGRGTMRNADLIVRPHSVDLPRPDVPI